jgi:nucleoside-diphosphate-sugar epimerase
MRRRYGEETVIVSDLPTPPSGTSTGRGLYEHLDYSDVRQLAEVVHRYDVGTTYYLAALLSATAETKPQETWNLNIGNLYNVLEVARQNRCRRLFPSSIGAFGPTTPRVRTPQATIPRPTTIYGITEIRSGPPEV